MQPDSIDPLVLQNAERHDTLKNIENTAEHQLLKQDEISQGIQDLNQTVEHLLVQGDRPEVQKVQVESFNGPSTEDFQKSFWNMIRGPKGEKGDKGDSIKGDKGDKGDSLTWEKLTREQKAEIKGEKGDKGDSIRGERGLRGERGPQGEKGEKGDSIKGERGLRGLKGEKGQDADMSLIKETVKDLNDKFDFTIRTSSSKTTSLVELDDVNLTGLTITNGKYNLGSGSGGTVTNTGGALTANSVVLGAGTNDTKVAAGIVTDGVSELSLGVANTTLGKLKLYGSTSGDVTIQPNAVAGTAVVLTAPATSGTIALTSDVVGLFDYRGAYDASGNTYPATGGSGTAGAVLKGDVWMISVAGTLGGTAVVAGDMVIATVDTPGQTAGNWDLISHTIGYTPENAANKVTSISGASTDVQYPSAKLLYDQLALKGTVTSVATGTGLTGGAITTTGTVSLNSKLSPMDTLTGNSLKFLRVNAGETAVEYATVTSGSGTVTHTGGALTSNAVVLGAGADDTKVVAGITSDGTAQLVLGVNTTTLGTVKMFGSTSGDVTIQPTAAAGTATVQTLPATTGTLVNRVTTANGVSASNSDGALTVTLGDITPTSVNSVTVSGSSTPTLSVTGTTSVSGSNTGDNAANSSSTYIGTTAVALNRTSGALSLTGVNIDGSAGTATTATNANNVNLANDVASATDYLVFTNTATGNQPLKTNTGVSVNPSTAAITATTFIGALTGTASGNLVSGGALGTPSSGTLTNCTFPTLNQDTTGSAVYWKTSGTGKAAITGPATGTTRTYTFPDADSTILYSGGALGTPASGTLTNCTGLPVAGITSSTSTALGVGSIELGHASDTSITRVSAGVAAIEGNNIVTNTSSPTLATITTTGNIELGHATDTTISRVSAGVAAIEGSNIMTVGSADTVTGVKTMSSVVLPTNGQVKLTVPTTDGHATGLTCGDFNCGYSSSAVGDLVYLDSSSTWQKCDANTVALYNGLLGIALEVKASANALLVALPGSFVYATGFPALTVGSPCYMSETAGAITQTAPTTTDAATRVIGWAIHADKIYFNPSQDYSTHV